MADGVAARSVVARGAVSPGTAARRGARPGTTPVLVTVALTCALAACASAVPLAAQGARGAQEQRGTQEVRAALVPRDARATDADTPRDTTPLPREIVRGILAIWNDDATTRVRGAHTVPAGDTVRGALAVLGGPLLLEGTVLGVVVVINGDAVLTPAARVRGDVTVVGGTLDGADATTVAGDVHRWEASLDFREDDGRLVPSGAGPLRARWQRWYGEDEGTGRWTDLLVTTAHTYNRVEGLPIVAGPRVRLRRGGVQAELSALGIFRTGERLVWDRESHGHRVSAELRLGRADRHVAVGARFHDEVAAVEDWTLGDTEAGLAAFVFTRDYRDYYNRHGGHAYVRLGNGERSTVTVRVGEERWRDRRTLDPFSITGGDRDWRRNPDVLPGRVRTLGASFTHDTRNDARDPRAGWYFRADYERGRIGVTDFDEESLALRVESLDYGRLFVDARRYLRITPHGALNLRVVAGGLLHGDALPAQRQLSLGGPGSLPGYGFRQRYGGADATDVGACSANGDTTWVAAGRPAGCDRILLLQAEWRGDFRISLFGARERDDDERWFVDGFRADGSWVVFANTGRGWRLGEREGDLRYGRGTLPSPGTFRSDVGVGVDFGGLGVYVAQPLDVSGERARVFLRVGRRF